MKNVADLYPVSPMQELMLLRSVSPAGQKGLVDQGCYELTGPLDTKRFARSWQTLVDRHPALRSNFVWEGLKQPLQAVRKKAELPFSEFDWTTISAEQQQIQLKEFRREDLAAGFDLGQTPLLRVALFRLGEERTFCVCTSHHLILDRWCISQLHHELGLAYSGQAIVPRDPTPYRDYAAWLKAQDSAAAESFWREQLRGFVALPTLLESSGTSAEPTPGAELQLSAATTGTLRRLARQNQVTLPTVAQLAWALVLARLTGRRDVVLGLTVAGRPLDLPGAEQIIGSFINNLPMRVQLGRSTDVGETLREIQRTQQSMRPYEYVALTDLQRCSGLLPGQPLFQTLAVWADRVPDPPSESGLQMRAVPGSIRTATPVTVVFVDGGEQLTLQIHHAGETPVAIHPQDLVTRLRDTLQLLADETAPPLADLLEDRRLGPSLARVDEASVTNGAPRLTPVALACAEEPNDERRALLNQLIAEWQLVLGIPVQELTTSFFDLGGTSFQAAQLHRRIQLITRKEVSMVKLFSADTVRGMAKTISESGPAAGQGIVSAIQPGGSKPPLFCVATPESNPIGYVALARHLGQDQPLYLLQAPPSSEDMERLSPEELANSVAPYLEAMQRVRESGPYCLLGMCWGAYLAFDMAKELLKQGQRVGFLGILDTWAKYTLTPMTYLDWLNLRASYYGDRISAYWKLPPGKRLAALSMAFTRKAGRLRDHAVSRLRSGDENPWDEQVHVRSDVDPADEFFEGHATILRRPKQPRRRGNDQALGWGRFCRSHSVQVLQCEVEEYWAVLQEPHVSDLAQNIEEALRNVAAAKEAS